MEVEGLRLAIISNCSSEEVKVIKQSKIYQYFDQVILSFEVNMQKPDSRIYKETANLLKVSVNECIFVGDGGSNELEGAGVKRWCEKADNQNIFMSHINVVS